MAGPDRTMLGCELFFAAAAQCVLLVVLQTMFTIGVAGWLTGLLLTSIVIAFLGTAIPRSNVRSLGPANRVTLVRAVLVGGTAALVSSGAEAPSSSTAILALATATMALDPVDGAVARRTGSTSRLGACFDNEVDAALVLILSVFAALSLGPWVLLIGAMRYLFVAAAWIAPALRTPLPPLFSRKLIGSFQGIALLLGSGSLLPSPMDGAIVLVALMLLIASFSRDALRLLTDPGRRGDAVETSVTAPRPHAVQGHQLAGGRTPAMSRDATSTGGSSAVR